MFVGGELADKRHVGISCETQHFAAAAGRGSLQLIASVDGASQRAAEKLLKELAKNRQTKHSCAPPMKEGGEFIEALSREDVFPSVCKYDEIRLVGAATWSAADFAETDGYDPPAGYQNLASAATAISDRELGLCGPQLLSTAAQYAAVAAQCGVTRDGGAQSVSRVSNSAPRRKMRRAVSPACRWSLPAPKPSTWK